MKNLTNFLTESNVGRIEVAQLAEVKKQISKAWEPFTEGLQGYLKENISLLYENQAKYLINEASDSSNSGSFETVVFPIIRRVFSKLLANDIVSVQAMNLPIGKLFFIIPVTSERQWEHLDPAVGMADGSSGKHAGLMGYERVDRNYDNDGKGSQGKEVNRYYLPDEVITLPSSVQPPASNVPTFDSLGNRNKPIVTQYMKTSLYDLFYNDFLYDNSKGRIWIKMATNAQPVTLNSSREFDTFTGGAGDYPVSRNDGSIRNVILKIEGFNQFNVGKLTGPDGNEQDTEAFLASLKIVALKDIPILGGDSWTTFKEMESIPFRVMTQKYGKGIVERASSSVCDVEGVMYLELDLTKPTTEQGVSIDGYLGIDPDTVIDDQLFGVSWAQYDSLELETEIGEVSFKLESVVVSVEERKLRATWSPELAQDVAAFHNIDAEAELTAILSEQIAAEIDREILRDLRKVAPWQARWDVNGWRRMAAFSTNYTQKDWNQELITKINQLSAQIHKSTLRGGANFVVVSSEISALLDNLEYFHVSDASPESDQYNMGIERVGTIQGRYQVYRDPYAPHYSAILGHKGKSLLDTGYVYAPYVPLQLTPTMYNPMNFAPVKGILTRYAKKVVNHRFYGAIRVDSLVTWNTNEYR
jgi:hypothetical protein